MLISSPLPAIYRIEVDYAGGLTHNEQVYSSVISGTTADRAAPPVVTACQPPAAAAGTTDLVWTLTGSNFLLGASVGLEHVDHAPRVATALQIIPATIG